jgi:DNA repair protein RecN (Recombination protein N)
VLSRLTIRNFAIVDQLEIEWQPGLNVITGETGAGKSILIDAVGALLGDRLGPEAVRSGAPRAMIEGVFAVPPEPSAELKRTLEEYGVEPEDGALIVSRDIAGTGGRGSARINGRTVPQSVLQEIGERLVDIHGQSEHMALLRAREQLDYLDRFAGTVEARSEVGRLVRELRETLEARRRLVADERETARLQNRLTHEISEIEAAALLPGEEQELIAQRARLQNVERLHQCALVAHQALAGDQDEGVGAIDLLGRAIAGLSEAGRLDPALAGQAEELEAALSQTEDAARALLRYLDALEADPQALETTMERLFLIADLKRKYGDSIPEILAYAVDARQRLGEIDLRSERLSELDATEASLRSSLDAASSALSGRRCTGAAELSRAVERELADLRLSFAQFVVAVEPADVDASGADRIEFRLSTTPGEEPRAMSRVASGGELARIALALKTVLSRAETRPTLIFDEIDVGVGGRTAPVVGAKLRAVASSGHQVLCVTHMAQVAAYADCHFVVARGPDGVSATRVEGDQRVEELAAMLGGAATDAAKRAARELLKRKDLPLPL